MTQKPWDVAVPVSQLSMCVVIACREQKIVYANMRACIAFGYEAPSDIVGSPIEYLIPKKIRRGHRAKFNEWFETMVPRTMAAAESDVQGVKKDGTHIHLRIALQPLDENHVAGLIHIMPRSDDNWWRRPKAVVGGIFLLVGAIMTYLELSFGQTLMGAAFGLLMALAGVHEIKRDINGSIR